MICCYDLFMAWFCCYDFDMVSVMILIWFQLCFLLWVKLVIWSQPIGTISKKYSKIVSKPYQYRIKIKSKPRKPAKNRPKTCPWAVSVSFFEANSLEPHQNRIKIISKTTKNVSKPYQNHTDTIKTLENSTKNLSLGCFCFFVWSQLTATISKPYQNHIKIVSKSYQNRNKTHIEIITPNSKHIKFISSNRIQNHIKIVKKYFLNSAS